MVSLPTYLEWPRDLIPPRHFDRGFSPQSAGGEQLSLTGRISNGGVPGYGIWKPQFIEVPVFDNRSSLIAIEGQLMGRGIPVMVPYYHSGFYPKFGESQTGSFADGATFSDGSGFKTSGTHVVVKTAANAGTVRVVMTKIECGAIQSGHVFSVGLHQYQVRVVEEQTDDDATVIIAPELRADIMPRDEVDFVFPAVKCRLIDPAAFSVAWQYNVYAFPDIKFIEDTAPTIS